MTVSDIDETKDIGTYQCIVLGANKQRSSARLDVVRFIGNIRFSIPLELLVAHTCMEITKHVFFVCTPGPEDWFINITEPSGKYDLEVSSKQAEVKWYLKYSSYPPIQSLVWRDARGNEIPWTTDADKDPSRKVEARLENRRITLTIRNIHITDSGYYTLYANNGQIEKEQKMQLRVKGKDSHERMNWF